MRLVERDEQVRYLDRLMNECRGRRGQIVLLNGPTTTGKTELLRVCADRAPEDVRVLRATCSRAEQSLPFGVLSQLLRSDALPGELSARVEWLLREGASADAPSRPDHDAVEAAVVRIVHGLGVAVLDLAARAPLLIAVDDVQHADVPSLHCLLYIARRLASARVLVVLTDEAEFERQHSPFRAELRRQPHFHQLRLAPLTREGVAAVLQGGAGTPADDTPLADTFTADAPPAETSTDDASPWDTDAFFRASGGNPLLLHALIEDRHIAGEPRAQGYGLALLSCLHRDRLAVLQVARSLAVLGEECGVDELSQLAGLDTETVSRALHDMDAAGLIDKRAFRHPVARAAVVDDISPQDRLALHRRAAQLMHDRGAPTMSVARHLVEARHTHGPWAVRVLLEAAEQAMLGEDPWLATECLKLAHRSSPDEQDRPAIRARLAQAEWELSPSAAARHLTPLVAAVRSGRLDQGDRLVLLRHLLWHGRTDEAETVLRHLRSTAGDQWTEARDIERWLAATHPPLARRSRHPLTRGGDIGHLLTPLSDPWWRSAADLGDLITRGPDRQAADRAEQILAETGVGRRSPWTEEAVQLALSVLICAGRPGSAADWCDRLNDPAAPRQTPVRTATLAAMRAEAAIRQGDLTAGADHARQALTHLAPKAWGIAIGLPLGSLVLAATRTGDYEEAAKCLTHSTTDAMFRSRYGLHYLDARGHFHLATNHPHAALADFLSCGELMRAWGLDASALIPWRTGAAEAWLRLGNPDQAKRLVYDELTRAGADDPRARGSALRLLAALGPVSRQPELLTEALDLLEDCGDGYEQARVLVDLCRSYHALDEHRRARMVFRRAWHVTKLCDAGPLSKELMAASGDFSGFGGFEPAPVGADGITSLTGSERRVAALAVMGCTNREIAGKLHITASTVEQHLTRVYRKLNVKRRKDLPVDLRNEGATTERTPLGRR
ncbi:AAA family ATPase (plasmid) [Streptomyces sp. NBC_00012]|uniref:helix-turn-helix transcriptional regulator n=1 Tax=Streptomyces sp. NBC_00012 TaxID=2975621 RepID=UPI002F906DA3